MKLNSVIKGYLLKKNYSVLLLQPSEFTIQNVYLPRLELKFSSCEKFESKLVKKNKHRLFQYNVFIFVVFGLYNKRNGYKTNFSLKK